VRPLRPDGLPPTVTVSVAPASIVPERVPSGQAIEARRDGLAAD
jgi:hypothetical protein